MPNGRGGIHYQGRPVCWFLLTSAKVRPNRISQGAETRPMSSQVAADLHPWLTLEFSQADLACEIIEYNKVDMALEGPRSSPWPAREAAMEQSRIYPMKTGSSDSAVNGHRPIRIADCEDSRRHSFCLTTGRGAAVLLEGCSRGWVPWRKGAHHGVGDREPGRIFHATMPTGLERSKPGCHHMVNAEYMGMHRHWQS